MEATLKDLNAVPGVVGSMLCNVRGRILARAFPLTYEQTDLQAAAAEVAERSRELRKATGSIKLIDVRYPEARLLVKPLGDLSLLLLCAKTVNLQMLLVSASVAGEKLEQMARAPARPAWGSQTQDGRLPRTSRQPAASGPARTASARPASPAQPDPRTRRAAEPMIQRPSGRPGKHGILTGALGGLGAAALLASIVFLLVHGPGGSRGKQPVAMTGAPIVRLAGADPLEADLASALAEAYLGSLQARDVQVTKSGPEEIRVQGSRDGTAQLVTIRTGGTAAGLDELALGSADVAIASRRVRAEEAQKLASLGVMTAPANEHVLALGDVAVIVNPANPVARLRREQLAAIFGGGVTDWSSPAIGSGAQGGGGTAGSGKGSPISSAIHVYAPDSQSGVAEVFQSVVLGKAFGPEVRRLPSCEAVKDVVLADPGGIGFVPLPFATGARMVPVSDSEGPPFVPTPFSVASEEYLLTHRLYLYNTQGTQNPQVSRFVEFALGPEGQAVVRKSGFVDLGVREEPRSAPSGASADYAKLIEGARRLSSTFRFESGTSVFDNRAQRDLERVVEYLRQNQLNGTAVKVLGFADSQGARAQIAELSRQRAVQVAEALAQRGVTGVTVAAFGSALPVADNASEAGRVRNRRVEIWVSR